MASGSDTTVRARPIVGARTSAAKARGMTLNQNKLRNMRNVGARTHVMNTETGEITTRNSGTFRF